MSEAAVQYDVDTGLEKQVLDLKKRSVKLYESRRYLCSEAVLFTLNHAFDGGLSHDQVIAMAAPFSMAMGESGCLCGALSGAVLGTGLILGQKRSGRQRRILRQHAAELHNRFKLAHGATCCRVLTKKVRQDKRAHFRHCASLTGEAAEMAARLILQARPELVQSAQAGSEAKKISGFKGLVLNLTQRFAR
ncbi:MAG: C_GCAxxG_C_C family protein [Desulfobacteraceae bacterium]|nr:MAG: C_GCAxxG_C_C family protein [Desulfobacteraceae bacterium]